MTDKEKKKEGIAYRTKRTVDRTEEEFYHEELCKAQREMYRERTLKKRACKTAEDFALFEASEAEYREKLNRIKLEKKENYKKLKAVERCFKRDGTELDAELEYRIPVDDMVELADIERDEVPENPYREKRDEVQVRNAEESIKEVAADIVDIGEAAETREVVTESFFTSEMDVTGNVEDAVVDNEVKLGIVVSDLKTDAEDKRLPEKSVVEEFGVVTSEFSEADLERNYTSEAAGSCLPQNKAEYMRMTVAEKVACYPFDAMGTEAAFDMVKDYFAKIGMYTDFNSVYEEMKLLTDYYEAQKAEELIGEKAEQVIENIGLLGIEADSLERYAPDVLADAFGFENLDYSAGVKLFRRVLDRLDVRMSQWEQYEMFDRIYQGGDAREDRGQRQNKR